MFSTLLALAFVAQAEPVQPAPKEEEQKVEKKKEEKVEDKRICRRITAGIGSRKKERVCMTRAQWREFNQGN